VVSAAVDYSSTYDPDVDFDAWYTDVTAAAVVDHVRAGDRVLELGCATGRMSARLARAGAEVLGVDRSVAYIERAADRGLPGARFVVADVEEHLRRERRRYHHVVATNLLHELEDPARFVTDAAGRLHPDGLLHLSLQNPGSLHRLVALEMGLIDDLHTTSDRGLAYGTRRSLTRDELVGLGTAAGLTPVLVTGLCLKPLPNALMATLPPAILDGMAVAARHAPDVAALNYVVLARG
jgi:2-polyprenyl-3-methyl-5-hydroxy-6-metoxy-1,4-benzoquinol methylase